MEKVFVLCRCGRRRSTSPFLCRERCKEVLDCGIHKCTNRCCSGCQPCLKNHEVLQTLKPPTVELNDFCQRTGLAAKFECNNINKPDGFFCLATVESYTTYGEGPSKQAAKDNAAAKMLGIIQPLWNHPDMDSKKTDAVHQMQGELLAFGVMPNASSGATSFVPMQASSDFRLTLGMDETKDTQKTDEVQQTELLAIGVMPMASSDEYVCSINLNRPHVKYSSNPANSWKWSSAENTDTSSVNTNATYEQTEHMANLD